MEIIDMALKKKTLRQKLRYHCDGVMRKLNKEKPKQPMATRVARRGDDPEPPRAA